MSQLALIVDDVVVKLFPLEKPIVTIGRHQDNDIQIDNDGVSTRHAQIRVEPSELLEGHEEIVIEDLDSTNGTFVNGKRINKKYIKADDEIIIGKHTLMIDIENFQKKSKTWSSGQTDRTYKISAFPRK